jgi:DNA-binding transcriptional ArsR family regulator
MTLNMTLQALADPTRRKILELLKEIVHPDLKKNLVELNMIKDFSFNNGTLNFSIVFFDKILYEYFLSLGRLFELHVQNNIDVTIQHHMLYPQ